MTMPSHHDQLLYREVDSLDNELTSVSNTAPTNNDNLNEDMDEFSVFEKKVYQIAQRVVPQIESKLDKYGFEIDLITDYEEYDVSDEYVGMYMSSLQDNASVFPIVLNAKCMYDYLKKTGDENDIGYITWGVKSTLWHEVGHGIVAYLSDVYDFDWDEEEVVEEFAIYVCDTGKFGGELYDALVEFEEEYLCESARLNESMSNCIAIDVTEAEKISTQHENKLCEDLALWDMEEKLIETFWSLPEDELMSYYSPEMETGGGAVWIRQNGETIELDLHQDFGNSMFWNFCRHYFENNPNEDYSEDDFALEDSHEYNDHLVDDYGWVKFNFGNTRYEDRCYVCLPQSMTAKQYRILESFLEECENTDLLVLPSDTGKSCYYDLDVYSPSDVIKRIRKFYASGVLEESVEETGGNNLSNKLDLTQDIQRSVDNVCKNKSKYDSKDDFEDAVYWAIYDCVRDLQFISKDKEEVIQDILKKELERVGTLNENQSVKTTLRFKIFNESTKNTRRIPNEQKKLKGSMTDIARKLGIRINEDLSLKYQTLLESKDDQQKFIDKFGKDSFDIFWNNKQRLKNKDVNVDILWHVKHTSVSDMRKILDSISDEQRSKELDFEGARMPAPTGNYDVVYEDNNMVVYHPKDYISSLYCAKGGRWCTAGGYNIPDEKVKVSQAKMYFNQYTDRGVELYYFVLNNGDRYALAVYPDGQRHEVFNKRDDRINGVGEIPGIEDVEIDGLDMDYFRENGGIGECYNCGDTIYSEDECYYYGDDMICESCYYNDFATCEHCYEIFPIDDIYRGPRDSGYFCSDCMDEKFYKCSVCGEYDTEDYICFTVDDDIVCENCTDNEGYVWCEDCGRMTLEPIEVDDAYYCEYCVDNNFTPCVECGALEHNRYISDVNGKGPLCWKCAQVEASEVDESVKPRGLKFRLVEDITAVKKNYPNISDKDFDRIIRLDPTFVEGRDSVGQYGKWLLNLFNKGRLDNEGHATDCLRRFEEEKKYLKNKDIGRFKSLSDVDDYLDNEENYNDKSHRQEVRDRQKDRKNADLDNEAEIAYKDNFWTVWVPDTYAASCKLGQGTSWCTASTESDYYFNRYNSYGPLYIIINNASPEEKYQFHFETSSFMDADDNPIEFIPFLRKEEGLYDFFLELILEYMGIDASDIEDGQISTTIYDEDDYKAVFDDQGELIYSVVGANGDSWRFFDSDYFGGVEWLPDHSDLPQSIKDEFERLGISDYKEEFTKDDDVEYAIKRAYSYAEACGSEEEARKDILEAIEDAGATYKNGEIYITCTIDEFADLLEEHIDYYGDYETILKVDFADKFNLVEPYYGWSGFDDEIFLEELLYHLSDIKR